MLRKKKHRWILNDEKENKLWRKYGKSEEIRNYTLERRK